MSVLVEKQIARAQNKIHKSKPRAWYYFISVCTMVPGVFIAFAVMEVLGPALHFPVSKTTATDYRLSILIGLLIAAVFFLMSARSESKEQAKNNELRLKNLENESLQAQLSALTAQMNPHLLFNSLNTVASLVQTDPSKAEDVILKLSELYRGVLTSSRETMNSLATEIAICEAYIEIEKARFGERIRARILIAPEVNIHETRVPSLILQPLVENAIKHGISSRSGGGEIILRATIVDQSLSISIEDDGVGLHHSSHQGTGVGIKNCRARLSLHYGERSQFKINQRNGGGSIVSIATPLSVSI